MFAGKDEKKIQEEFDYCLCEICDHTKASECVELRCVCCTEADEERLGKTKPPAERQHYSKDEDIRALQISSGHGL